MKYGIIFTTRFKKDYKLAKMQDKDIQLLMSIINKLAEGETLDTKYRDHYLQGEYSGTRECHIEPDWLLIYEIIDDKLVLILNRVGSHSDLFD